jgi:hypothetical protein
LNRFGQCKEWLMPSKVCKGVLDESKTIICIEVSREQR